MICRREQCNQEFEKNRPNRLYCSMHCQMRNNGLTYIRRKRARARDMATQESQYCTKFVDCAIRQGGYAFKIAMSAVSGLPDLYCAMPGHVPVLLEAKLIKDVGSKFSRTIKYSKLQHNLLTSCNAVYTSPLAAYGLIFVKDYMGEDYCILMNPDVPIITDNELRTAKIGCCITMYKDMIDVSALFYGTVHKL